MKIDGQPNVLKLVEMGVLTVTDGAVEVDHHLEEAKAANKISPVRPPIDPFGDRAVT